LSPCNQRRYHSRVAPTGMDARDLIKTLQNTLWGAPGVAIFPMWTAPSLQGWPMRFL
jgi:hypothetical protein